MCTVLAKIIGAKAATKVGYLIWVRYGRNLLAAKWSTEFRYISSKVQEAVFPIRALQKPTALAIELHPGGRLIKGTFAFDFEPVVGTLAQSSPRANFSTVEVPK
jgi:hypothetical protein